MVATYIQQSIEQLKTNIFMHVRHRTLIQYTGSPLLDENQLFYLLLPFLNGEKWDEQIQESAITVGIVHASLSEHDKISETNATSKEQQLTVLSGDYYSGRYYEILAHSGNITLIRQLSEGIVTRCEHQIKLYESTQYTINEWYQITSGIQTELIKRFYQVYQFEQYSSFMHTALLLLQLRKELRNHQNDNPSSLFLKMKESVSGQGNSIVSIIQSEIDSLNNLLNEYLQSSSYLKDDLKLYIKQQVAFNDKLTRER
ncbi:heptaprenyl diphosphate synthase component 1 [Lysinibacillus sp. SGAir0095]|uniref:heptaprenyl diphosphate synthase component 1 n=1 Tax=Lysinibacillus sp. SGAir0095 TaxID=2070463 RepID=UPI0010CD5B40|nr:heptaprenyl diphosphate synthase component 1 [Lysinibacillus sp. SGAir0095]QCR32162.1 heptaprenyl diphosphate synthase [Lysinibacillus sp. SGAir0095]